MLASNKLACKKAKDDSKLKHRFQNNGQFSVADKKTVYNKDRLYSIKKVQAIIANICYI